MIVRRDVFQAIADPTRRQIIQRVAEQPLNLNSIAGTFNITRQSVSRHIQILSECGVIEITQKGRERFCEARLDKLNEVISWVEQSRQHWASRFAKLEKHLDHVKAKNKKK